ncbi:MAG: ClpXP protease specificity-enhancing factor [Gammaproteobacteria bacterium]|uniref:ClpXP protease specificity-enhancing factor n=1 Tax=Pseudomaricurvus alcaniphilus TaxID=1166482 RepID=UPI0014081276|nr:ClpXP protease specificity-enhancing factor [Pseudomaricurvus alcaniphilus]MBR9910553.1 ClpXP protease specificity-enhancing factor [Gammaproteobacteria bacterium]NHN39648.1 ClpXP protease specificity-enhancing factor [Pseudomaricurvus alcaniphilus]
MGMTSSRPYMIRALYDWIVDNECTPYILVDAHAPGVQVPQQFVNKEGQIVLNIAPTAVMELSIESNFVSFNARFGGIPTDIFVPCAAVLGVYARENGQGMIFEPESEKGPEPPHPTKTKPKPKLESAKAESKRPSLKVVK